MAMNLGVIFKAYDIRGLVPEELNKDTAKNIGRALADWLIEECPETSDKPIVVGRDMRADSQELSEALIAGITRQGRDVVDIGQVTTDMIYFAVGHMQAAGGVVVTASHNPGAYNGMKLCREEARAIGIDSGLEDIKQRMEKDEFADSSESGAVSTENVMNDWVEHALSFVGDELRPLKIAVDAGNGMAGAVMPHVEQQTPLHITPLYFELDGSFPNHEANPMKEETMADLQRTVVEEQLDIGIAFDGDGDRMMLVDEKGVTVSGSVTCALLSEYFLGQHPGSTILHNAICSRVVPETIRENGGDPIITKVGHSFIKATMRKYDAPFGGEHSAHYYFRDNWSADSGLIAALIAIGIVSRSGKSLSDLVRVLRQRYVQSGEINLEVKDKQAAIERVAEHLSDGKQDRLDGLTVDYGSWWCNIRPSNTEPLIRLNIEAVDKATLKYHQQRLLSIIV